tara:strand:- start:1728 stop:2033 length:306 start_codon:yes stop_codon:yes gene_type:complete
MSFSTKDFDKWMKKQGPIVDLADSTLTDGQIKILKEYPECETANDLPFDIQEMIIEFNDYDNATTIDGQLQNEVDAFLMNQYSLLSRKFKEHVKNSREPIK